MPSPFDGMGAALSGALGGTVIHRPRAGGTQSRHWHLREYPYATLPGEDRSVLSVSAELRVPRDQIALISVGDEVEGETGERYEITARVPTTSPGVDALVAYELEKLT